VVAYALAGTLDIDLINDPIGLDEKENPIFLRDLWPSGSEILETIKGSISPKMFIEKYGDVYTGNQTWNEIHGGESEIFDWNPESTYIQEPPFFQGISSEMPQIEDIHDARVLAVLGDSITTDHISPAGRFAAESPAGRYLTELGVPAREFNSYGSRRGNDRVMTRGTLANIRLKNKLVGGIEGGETLHLPDGEQYSIFDAAMRYKEEGVPLIILAGKEYGSGSSRDWAAKGTMLLGVKAVIVESFERIHRSNLIGMGVLPLQFRKGENLDTLGLNGKESYSILGLKDEITPGIEISVHAEREDGIKTLFNVIVRLDTETEIDYYRNGGILPKVLRDML
jgi:aconitate hydratase